MRKLDLSIQVRHALNRRYFVVYSIIAVLLIHCLTLHLSPITWLDEVQIVEFGRLLHGGDLSWGTILSQDGRIVRERAGIFYLGTSMHYLANCLIGNQYGSRFLSLLFLGIFAWLVNLWSYKLTGHRSLSNFVSVLVLVDPFITQSVRGARCDIEVYSYIICSLLMITLAVFDQNKENKYRFFAFFSLAGAFFALAVFTWITALILALIIACYSITLLIEKKMPVKNWIWAISGGLSGASLVSFILCLIYPGCLSEAIKFSFTGIATRIDTSNYLAHLTGILSYGTHSPVLFAGCLLAFFTRWPGKWLWLGIMPVFLYLICSTGVYTYRVLYLVPLYLILTVYLLHSVCELQIFHRHITKFQVMALCYLLALVTYTVVGRTANAFSQYSQRENSWILAAFAESEIGKKKGEHVFVEPESLYYTGQQLGWKQISDENLALVLSKYPCKYLIFSSPSRHFKVIPATYELLEIIAHPNGVQSLYGKFEIWKRMD